MISVYGPTDLRYGYEHPAGKGLIDTRGCSRPTLAASPANADDAYFAASPINFVSPSSPPTLLIHGLNDRHVLPEESARLEAKLQASSVKHMYVRLPWATHGCDWSFKGPCGQISTYAVEQFLERVMKAPVPPKEQAERLAQNRAAAIKRGKN